MSFSRFPNRPLSAATIVACFCAVVSAQTEWIEPMKGRGPIPRVSHSLVFDSQRGKVVRFGGRDASRYLQDLWELNATGWVLRMASGGPVAVPTMPMAFDSLRGRCVQPDLGATPILTWEWDGTRWFKLQPAQSPGFRLQYSIGYDSWRAKTILVGGNQTGRAETWEWDGVNWQQRFPTQSPQAVSGAAMAFDPLRGCIVLFGGVDAGPSRVRRAETWEWDGVNWTQRILAGSPPARNDHGMAYDTDRNRILMYGGGEDAGFARDTWAYDGTSWTRITMSPRPLDRAGAGVTYDSVRKCLVVFGGGPQSGDFVCGDTWEWDGSTWTQREPIFPIARQYHGMAYDPVRKRTVLYGGRNNSTAYFPHNAFGVSVVMR